MRTWDVKVALAYFKVLYQQLPGKTEETMKNLSQENQSVIEISSPGPQQYEAEVMTIQLQHSVKIIAKKCI
jgi:hypothetical protein